MVKKLFGVFARELVKIQSHYINPNFAKGDNVELFVISVTLKPDLV